MNRQYIACQFGQSDRAYTYHNDGEPLAIGDRVVVQNRSGESTLTVVVIHEDAPPFDTKPVLRKAEPLPDLTADTLTPEAAKAFNEALDRKLPF